MSVLNREALEASPLADLHQIASEMEISGYRRLRKADLIDRLLGEEGGAADAPPAATGTRPKADREPRRRERTGGGESTEPRRRERKDAGDREPRRRERAGDAPRSSQGSAEGPLTIQESGAGFVQSKDGEQVYVSAAQIRRLELSAGDVVGGPTRPARRSEKHPSLVRVETINGRSADEVAPPVPAKSGATKQEAVAALPSERIALTGDSTLAQIDKVAPIGRGSRVVLHGGPHSGKSTAARSLAAAFKAAGIEVFTVLVGVRQEEVADWSAAEPAAVESIDSSPDTRAKAVERALDKARRVASNGRHAALVIDSADDLPGASIRKTLASAKTVPGAGSLTVVAVARAPLGAETTVIGFDQALAAAGKFPSLRVRSSSTLRPDLLVDGRALKALHKAHSDAVKKER